jgi:hypothetical protein
MLEAEMMRVLAVILLITCATAAHAGHRHRHPAWWSYDGRVFAVTARACDPVSRRCVRTLRYFTNPVWR